MQRVREATDLVALIGRRVSLKRVGSRHVGLCPFHTEKTPSFSVDPAKGFYHCFGCKASGDAITFLREVEHLDFTDAVEQLAAAANITLTYDAPGAQRANQRRKELLDLLEKAARFYHERLMNSADAGQARAYLRRRGYDRDTVVKWRLGYATPRWDELCRHLGAPPEQMAAAGLVYAEAGRARSASRRGQERPSSDIGATFDAATSGEPGNTASDEPCDDPGDEPADDDVAARDAASASDFFRDRIMFPICDASGRVVSFAGRLLPRPDEPAPKGPKYKNTVGTAVYDKSKVLYGLNFARQAARTAERIVVCEGYTDVIGCDLAGISEAVATCGTALTQQHAELLSRSATRIVLAFDADAAGQTATERVHQWEREHGLDIFVATLPPGADPGELAETNPPALRRALEEAQPLHAFRAERILQRSELDSPSGRDRAADEAAEVLAVYPPDVLKDADFEPIASRIPMEVADLRLRVNAARERLTRRPTSSAPDYYDAPPPPDPGEDYFVPEYPGDWDPALSANDRLPESTLASRVQVRINHANQGRARRERLLLEAVAAPEGDAITLVTTELFDSDAARAAFSRIASDPNWLPRVDPTHPIADVKGEDSDSADGIVRELLTSVAEEAKKLTAPEAIDRVAKSLLDAVRSNLSRIEQGGDIPFVSTGGELSQAEWYRLRRALLLWHMQRERELGQEDLRIGAVQDLARLLTGGVEAPELLLALTNVGE